MSRSGKLVWIGLVVVMFYAQGVMAQTLEIRDSMGYSDQDDAVVIGWVTNRSNRVQEFLKVEVSLKDDQGTVVDTGVTYTTMDKLLPGESSPFSFRARNVQQFATYQLRVRSRPSRDVPPRAIEVLEANGTFNPASGIFSVEGRVKNTSDRTSKFVQISCIGVQEAEGQKRIAGVGFTFPSRDELGPGEETSFRLIISNPPRPIESYILVTQAEYR